MFAQPYLGFAEGPVFVAHQAENDQQLRLGELMFAETRPVGRQNRSRRFQGHASKGQETNLWHGTSCSSRKHHRGAPVSIENCLLCRGCQQSSVSPIIPVHTQKQGGGGISRKMRSLITPLFSFAMLTIGLSI